MIETILLCTTVPVSVMAVVLWARNTFLFPLKKQEDAVSIGNSEEAVSIYVFIASPHCPSASPLSTKVTLFSRMCGIPHIVKNAFEKGMDTNKKGKVPFLEHDGNFVADSQLMLRYLENTFDVTKMSSSAMEHFPGAVKFTTFDDLTPEQQAISTMVRITLEDHLYWCVLSARWLGDVGLSENEQNFHKVIDHYFSAIPAAIRYFLVPTIRVKMARDAWSQGLARHSPKDQLFLAKRAIKSISTTLGDKPFFHGDFVCETDCVVFSFIQGMVSEKDTWPNPLSDYIAVDCTNLVRYGERIQNIYFPDFKSGDKLPKSKPDFKAIIRKELKKTL